MEEAEKRLNRTFPKELREFYLQIGYGFMWRVKDRMFINRIMDPDSAADLLVGENIYEDYYLVDELAEYPYLFPFFEVADEIMISLYLSQETDNGNHPVDYTGLKVANSLEDFFQKLDAEQDYYVQCTYTPFECLEASGDDCKWRKAKPELFIFTIKKIAGNYRIGGI